MQDLKSWCKRSTFYTIRDRVISDITTSEDRNKYLSRLDACGSFSFIVGPALGGVLAQVSNHFPMYIAGLISGIAMIVAFIFLKESNPKIIRQKEAKKVKNELEKGEKSNNSLDTENVVLRQQEKELNNEKSNTKTKVKITSTMILCLVFEFSIRWTINAFASRYGIYLNDKWGVSSMAYS